MWAEISAGILSTGAVGIAAYLTRHVVTERVALARQVGELTGEVHALKAELVEADRQESDLREELARARAPRPSLDDLGRVLDGRDDAGHDEGGIASTAAPGLVVRP